MAAPLAIAPGALGISYLATIAIFSSYPHLALADAYAVLFASPLLITALSAVVLGEQVGWRRWTAVAVGFLGVLVVLDPGHGVVAVAGAIVLAGAVGHAFNMLYVRKIGLVGEAVEATGTAGNVLTCLLTLLVLPWVWQTPSASDLGLAAVAGTIAGSAILLPVYPDDLRHSRRAAGLWRRARSGYADRGGRDHRERAVRPATRDPGQGSPYRGGGR